MSGASSLWDRLGTGAPALAAPAPMFGAGFSQRPGSYRPRWWQPDTAALIGAPAVERPPAAPPALSLLAARDRAPAWRRDVSYGSTSAYAGGSFFQQLLGALPTLSQEARGWFTATSTSSLERARLAAQTNVALAEVAARGRTYGYGSLSPSPAAVGLGALAGYVPLALGAAALLMLLKAVSK